MARQDRELEAIEDELVEAWRLLMRMPDRERGFLLAGSRSAWPQIVRDRITDYADEDAEPRLPLRQRDVAKVERVFGLTGERYALSVVPERDRQLVGLVLARKAGRMPGGFTWSDIWTALGGRALGVTSDALSRRYERALRKVAAVLAIGTHC